MNGKNMEKYFMERERFRVLENIDAHFKDFFYEAFNQILYE